MKGTNDEFRRLSWDDYFMYISIMASIRSNCIKRKVGCIIVKNNRILATGMNGTPSGVENCLDGGCPRCNDPLVIQGTNLDSCFCIHAEENCLLELPRHAMIGSYIYCSSHPCLGCLKKIIQCGITKIFYFSDYIIHDSTQILINSSNIQIKQIKVDITASFSTLIEQ
jgi:dCMP deaminase